MMIFLDTRLCFFFAFVYLFNDVVAAIHSFDLSQAIMRQDPIILAFMGCCTIRCTQPWRAPKCWPQEGIKTANKARRNTRQIPWRSMFEPINVGDVLLSFDNSEFGRPGGVMIIVYEHNDEGTTGLVLNRPTPLRIGDLDLPFLHAFSNNLLFHGEGGLTATGRDASSADQATQWYKRKVTSGHNLLSNIGAPEDDEIAAIDRMSPQRWLHSIAGLKGSMPLRHGVFAGGSLRGAESLIRAGMARPADFKFFYGAASFAGRQLQREWDAGLWHLLDEEEAAAGGGVVLLGSATP